MASKKLRILTEDQKTELAKRRQQIHQLKRGNAFMSITAKVKALGDDALFDEYEEAAYLGKSVQWLRDCRMNGGGPAFRKIGSAVRYRLGDHKHTAINGGSL